MFHSNLRVMLALVTASVAAPAGFAANIVFNDSGAGPATISVTGADAARVTGAGCASDGSGGEICNLTLNAPSTYVLGSGVGVPGFFNIFQNPTFTQISDTFAWTINFNTAAISMTFHSSDTQSLVSGGFYGTTSIAETGALQSLGGYSWGGTGVFDSVNFVSSDAPEPATFLLVPAGLVAIGLRSRRKRAA